jgi:ATP-dependent exoDNAse (exonuclease V) beta subunit
MKYSNDKRVVFESESHSYFNKDKKLLSVTTFLHKFKNEFDSDFFSKKIALRDGKTQKEILDLWSAKAKKSCDIGTAIHKIFEDYINGDFAVLNGEIQIEFLELPIEYYLDFHSKAKVSIQFIKDFFVTNRLIPVHTEYIVYDDNLAGQVDLICKDKNDNYYILDFKTNDKIEKYSYNKKMLNEFSILNDSNFYHYSLQLSIYKKMIKEIDIKKLFIIHIKLNSYEIIECEDIFEKYNINYKSLF